MSESCRLYIITSLIVMRVTAEQSVITVRILSFLSLFCEGGRMLCRQDLPKDVGRLM
jgi:hypothetical protein